MKQSTDTELVKDFRVNGMRVDEETFNAAVSRSEHDVNSDYDSVEVVDQQIDGNGFHEDWHNRFYNLFALDQWYGEHRIGPVVSPINDMMNEATEFINTYCNEEHISIEINSNKMSVRSDDTKELMTIESTAKYYQKHLQKED